MTLALHDPPTANWLLNLDPPELSSAHGTLSRRFSDAVAPVLPSRYEEWPDVHVSQAQHYRKLVIEYCKERKYYGLWIVVEEAPKEETAPSSPNVESPEVATNLVQPGFSPPVF
ncbi:hypothetical protein HDU86_001861 [Geranomyces michiganensis]|nr:hypothetical protein HDU86_001861 [Geranomyces michiganensis]